MQPKPIFTVQLYHLQGPLKGRLQEFAQPVISIGRLPSMDIRFPNDQVHVSRDTHARIVRAGDSFKLIDQSANGTIVNEKLFCHAETVLNTGDVLIFPPGSPKIAFSVLKVEKDAPPSGFLNAKVPAAATDGPPDTPQAPTPASRPAKLRTEWLVALGAAMVLVGLLIGLHIVIAGNWQDFIAKAIVQPAKSVLKLFTSKS